MHKRSLVWLRRDLRCSDHRAWSEAESASHEIAVAFVFDSKILQKIADSTDRRLTFIYDTLLEVQRTLAKTGSRLVVRYGDPALEVPRLAAELGCDAVYANRDYEPYAVRRDFVVRQALTDRGINFFATKDQVIFEKDEVKNRAGAYFKVFTPYAKAWREIFDAADAKEAKVRLTKLMTAKGLAKTEGELNLARAGFDRTPIGIAGGSTAAEKLLANFLKRSKNYKVSRDFPADEAGTSHLSVHLRFGTISIRELFRRTERQRNSGTLAWRTELIWREFYSMLLAANSSLPDSCFHAKYNSLEWPGSPAHFARWCEGTTGYPLIDAAMRHFNDTGWMHNRLRMIVASFLTKDLLCHWKWGEKYFADNLLDFDLASNNGGWQWAASVGCDAQPYFRIFNPVLQSQRFDPRGEFIRTHVPELSALPDKFIHAPWTAKPEILAAAGVILGKTYPLPIVDHGEQKSKAIQLFKS